MDENEVIDAVCRHLEQTDVQVLTRCTTTERGIDVEARDGFRDYFIEAKGGTSSRKGSARYGLPYTENQVFDRVSKGFWQGEAMGLISRGMDGGRIGSCCKS